MVQDLVTVQVVVSNILAVKDLADLRTGSEQDLQSFLDQPFSD